MTMEIELYSIINSVPKGKYSLTYGGDTVELRQVLKIVSETKRRFKIAGRMYIMKAGDKLFFVTKVKKEWLAYELIIGAKEDV